MLSGKAPLALNTSPEAAFRSDRTLLRFASPETVTNAFLHCEERKVDKAGCISFMGKKYEVGLTFIGCTVDVIYDPTATDELTIEYKGHAPFKVKELVIGERTGKRPGLPEHLRQKAPESSRLLAAAGKKHQQKREEIIPAVSYRVVRKGMKQMFESFYGFARTPFSRDIPTDHLYPSVMLEETIGRLEYAAERQLFAVLTGDSGTGKTTAIRRFKDSLNPSRFMVMYLADSSSLPGTFTRACWNNWAVRPGSIAEMPSASCTGKSN